MYSSATNHPAVCEEGCFESTEKELAVETINFIPIKTFSNEMSKHRRMKEESIVWKLSEIKNPHNIVKRSNYRFSKNISFEVSSSLIRTRTRNTPTMRKKPKTPNIFSHRSRPS